MDILSCMQFVLHAGQLGVFFLNNFALAEQWQNSERLNWGKLYVTVLKSYISYFWQI